MLRIRLARSGTKKKPFYRLVVIDRTKKVAGQAIETIGYWDPRNKKIEVEKEKYNFWKNKGALPSEKVKQLLV